MIKTLKEIEDMLAKGKDLGIVENYLAKYEGAVVNEFLANSKAYSDRMKAKGQEQREAIYVEHNGVPYQGDFGSINYMSAVVAVANFNYNKALAEGASKVDAYEAVFKKQIPWKNKDNELSLVQIESVAEALEKTMYELAGIIGAE